jgi:hypothetical protein
MNKITLVIGLALVLVLPTVAGAKPTPNAGDKRAAVTECKTLRGGTAATREAFLTQFRNFGACVTKKAVEEAQEAQDAHKNAAKECAAERSLGEQAFAEKYGTERTHFKNAFGKCVSQLAKAKEHEADAEDVEQATEFKNAAKACADERSKGEEAFALKYGTERTHRKNAFGKCVSQTVHANNESESEQATS